MMVVGMRLGCLNHALLTVAAIESAGVPLAGWVANCLPPPCDVLEENINTLRSRISSPLLGIIPVLAETNAKIVSDCLAF